MLHKWYVLKVGLKLGIPIVTLILHDLSKFSRLEFTQYAKTFYYENGGNTFNPSDQFDEAWLHHQKVNKHHHQAWVLLSDEGTLTPLPIPYPYVHEMVTDWLVMEMMIPDSLSASDFYLQKCKSMCIHPTSRYLIELLLFNYSSLKQEQFISTNHDDVEVV